MSSSPRKSNSLRIRQFKAGRALQSSKSGAYSAPDHKVITYHGMHQVMTAGGSNLEDTPVHRCTSLTIKRIPLRPYRRPMPRVLGGSKGGGRFLLGKVALYVITNMVKVNA
jgi:hypothetical protein